MRQYFVTVPDDLLNAAQIYEMSEFSIRLDGHDADHPSGTPRLGSLLRLGALEPRFLAEDRDLFTLPPGLREFCADVDGNYFGPMMASANDIVTPLIPAFLLATRRYVEGISLSGMT